MALKDFIEGLQEGGEDKQWAETLGLGLQAQSFGRELRLTRKGVEALGLLMAYDDPSLLELVAYYRLKLTGVPADAETIGRLLEGTNLGREWLVNDAAEFIAIAAGTYTKRLGALLIQE